MSTSKIILLVDDERDYLATLAEFLEAEGFKVDTATDGEQALARLAKPPVPDLVVLDLKIPLVDGWSLLAWIKENAATRAVRFLIHSGAPADELMLRALKADRSVYLGKPCSPTQLLEAVLRQLSDEPQCARSNGDEAREATL